MARAMVLRPELLLIDNPFSGLDPAHNRWWREFMEALISGHPWFSNEPVTVVIASDELQPVLSIGNQFVLIQDGHWEILGDRQAIESDHSTLIQDLLHIRT
jgi:ABC-type transporter Mla maintaining outer membrane lipid asymmetry ATPase subunit MlaF